MPSFNRKVLFYPAIILVYLATNYFVYRAGDLIFSDTFFHNIIPLLIFCLFTAILYTTTKDLDKKRYKKHFCYSISIIFTLTIVMPFFFIDVPHAWKAPDISYNVAKIWRAYDGHLFVDAVTGYLSIYPSIFHLFWGGIMHIVPMTAPKALVMSTIFHVAFLMFSSFILMKKLFDISTAALTTMLVGLIFYLPNIANTMLAINNTFSYGFFILGLYFFYRGYYENASFLKYAGLLFGFSTALWPHYLFLLLVLLVVFIMFEKRKKNLLKKLLVLFSFYLIPLIYLVVHTIVVAQKHLLGSQRFGFSHGIPDFQWLSEFIYRFFSLGGYLYTGKGTVIFFSITYIMLFSLAFYRLFFYKGEPEKHKPSKNREKFFIKIICLGFILALLVLFYFFGHTYPRRTQILMNVLVVGLSANFLLAMVSSRTNLRVVGISLISFFVVTSVYYNTYKNKAIAGESQNTYLNYLKFEKPVVDKIASLTNREDRIFSTREGFRSLIMANIPRYGLISHRDGNYFYLYSKLSAEILNDYNAILSTRDLSTLNSLMEKYSMKYSLLIKYEIRNYPGLQTMYQNYEKVFEDRNFVILKRSK